MKVLGKHGIIIMVMYRGRASMVTLAHQFKHVTKGLWLFKTGGSDAQFQSDPQKPTGGHDYLALLDY